MDPAVSIDDDIWSGKHILESALMPHGPKAFRSAYRDLWERGFPRGSLTGWPSVDKHYSVVPGQLSIVTGWPGSGKSEWVDALLMNLAKQGWRHALFSPENHPTEMHVIKLLEKYLRKPFGDGLRERMSLDECDEAANDIDDWFHFLIGRSDKDKTGFTVEDILIAAELHFRMMGYWGNDEHPKGLVIDPWNEIEHMRPRNISETEYISMTLTQVRGWARKAKVHVWMVAHPQKLNRDRETGKLPVPKPDTISGSSHWWNKADVAITVHREVGDAKNRTTEIHVWKVRFKNVGSPGMCELEYDRATGCYSEQDFGHVRGVK